MAYYSLFRLQNFKFIHINKHKYIILQSAKVLKNFRQGYHNWIRAIPSKTSIKHEFLIKEIYGVYRKHNDM